MTLTNYWWLLIWLFVGGVILMYFRRKQENGFGKQEQRWDLLPAIILVIPLIVWAGFRSINTAGFDTSVYNAAFLDAPGKLTQLPEYLDTITKDKGFSVLTVIIKCVVGNSPELYFLILASFQMLCVAFVYRKYSCDYWFSIFIFVASTEYISWMHNSIRQFTAVALVFAAAPFLFKKKYVSAIAIILIASTIHGSALLMLPVIFIVQGRVLNKKTIVCVIAVVIALLCVNQFTNLLDTLLSDTQYKNVVSDWQSFEDDGTSPLRALVYSVPAILVLVGRKYIRNEDNPVIQVAANASIITAVLSWLSTATSGIFIGRIPIWTSLYASGILLPWEIDNLFTKESAKLIKSVAIICYVIFFYYQMHFAWGIM